MKIVLPLGPTDNRRLTFSPRIGRMIAHPDYRAWKPEAVRQAKMQWDERKPLAPTFESQLPYTVKIYLKDKRTDQANYDKGLRDVLTEAGIWDDDQWVYPVFTPCSIDKENPRIEITI